MDKRTAVLTALDKLEIHWTITEHPLVHTIEEMDHLGITAQGDVCKNLFVRNAKGNVHYLIVLPKDKQANLTSIAQQLGSTRLSFASEQRLEKHLGLVTGAVSPLGVINDEEHEVIVVLDRTLKGNARLGFHPNDNTATVWISFDGLIRYINHFGNPIVFIS